MTTTSSSDASNRSLTRDVLHAALYSLGGRRTLFFIAAVLIVAGIALNWGWLAAVGVAPILISLLPCAVMCALGLCMHKMTGDGHASDKQGTAGSAQVQPALEGPSYDLVCDTADLIDPVSRRRLSAATAVASVHQGRIYYFEDRANRDAFEAETAKYLGASPLTGREVGSSGNPDKPSQQGHGCC